tara:strand:+ start:615 stop:1652 length:1038 start_codon:yes stop_codon:yes gene_type:complete
MCGILSVHSYLYCSVSSLDKILVFDMDKITGELEQTQVVAVPGSPAPLTVHPMKQSLYVAQRGNNQISSFSINQSTGHLTALYSVRLNSDPCYIATDKSGKFLLSAYYKAGAVSVHSIGGERHLEILPIDWISTATGAHCIMTDPSNSYAFVPHIAGEDGPNTVLQFKFNSATGQLSPNSPHIISPDQSAGPRHFCFHPKKDIVYFSNEQGSSVTAYNMDTVTGCLQPFQTLSTLPSNFVNTNTCAQIHIDPSGKFLYVSNRGHDSIACFVIDSADGSLKLTENLNTQKTPRAFCVSAEGKFLFVAGLDSRVLEVHKIDQSTGTLEIVGTYPVGKGVMWITQIDL